MPWTEIVSATGGFAGQVAYKSATTALVAAGTNEGGAVLVDATTKSMNQTLAVGSMILSLALSTSGAAVAAGPALLGAPVSYLSKDGGTSWVPSQDKAAGFNGAVAGHKLVSMGGSKFAYVAEFNSWANGTVCHHAPISLQCSGVLISEDSGSTWDHIDWGGTDSAGCDSQDGAFPSDKVWYLSGGYYAEGSSRRARKDALRRGLRYPALAPRGRSIPEPIYYARATIMKTEDGGKSFRNVFNVTTPSDETKNAGFGIMNDIGCSGELLCYAVSTCQDSNPCMDTDKPKERGYGSYIHKTADGGVTWDTVHFEYEMVFDTINVLSAESFVIAGQTVGFLGSARIFSSTDGGKTLNTSSLPGAGIAFDVDMARDGKTGWATAIKPDAANSGWSVWQFKA